MYKLTKTQMTLTLIALAILSIVSCSKKITEPLPTGDTNSEFRHSNGSNPIAQSLNNVLLITMPGQQSKADSYVEIFNELYLASTITDDFHSYSDRFNDYGAVFLIEHQLDKQILEEFVSYINQSGNIYFEKLIFDWSEFDSVSWFFEQYLKVNWATCDRWPFTEFYGITGTIMEGYEFSFETSRLGSILVPVSESVETILNEDNNCGCVAVATTTPDYHIIAAEFDLTSIVDDEYPNNRVEMFREFFQYFGIATDLDVFINMSPVNSPLVVPAGENFIYEGLIIGDETEPQVVDVWIKVKLPDGNYSDLIRIWEDFEIDPGHNHYYPVYQYVPYNAILGEYLYIAYIGQYPIINDSTYLPLTISEPLRYNSDNNWGTIGWGNSEEKINPVNEITTKVNRIEK